MKNQLSQSVLQRFFTKKEELIALGQEKQNAIEQAMRRYVPCIDYYESFAVHREMIYESYTDILNMYHRIPALDMMREFVCSKINELMIQTVHEYVYEYLYPLIMVELDGVSSGIIDLNGAAELFQHLDSYEISSFRSDTHLSNFDDKEIERYITRNDLGDLIGDIMLSACDDILQEACDCVSVSYIVEVLESMGCEVVLHPMDFPVVGQYQMFIENRQEVYANGGDAILYDYPDFRVDYLSLIEESDATVGLLPASMSYLNG